MRKQILAVACLTLGALAFTAQASATNAPKKANKLSVDMVTAFNQCTAPSLTHRPSLALPACPPAESSANNPASVYTFGDKNGKEDGSMNVTFQALKGDFKISVKSRSIFKNGLPYTGNDLSFAYQERQTDNGCGAAFDVDCTIVDAPWPVGLTCTAGSCKSATATHNATLPGAIHAGDLASIDIGQLYVSDEDGDAVAKGGLFVGPHSDNAAFNTPKTAKQQQVEMITAFNQCTAPTLTHRPALALPSCVPVQSSTNDPTNVYEFGQKNGNNDGSFALKLSATNGDVKFSAKSKSILKNGSPYSGNDLAATALIRATDNGCGASFTTDCTIVDFPFPVALTCTNGSCAAVNPTVNAMLPAALHPNDSANLEIGQISVMDEDGDAVARGGLLIP